MNTIKITKKCKIIILCLLTVFGLMSGLVYTIKAADINSIEPTGYFHTGNYSDGKGNSMWYNNQALERITINGEVGFCVEPYRLVGQWGNYTPNAYSNDLLSKIVYHGYWTSARTLYDYAVTQIMIWEAMGHPPTSTTITNYVARKAEIMNAVNNHDAVPSFTNGTYTLNKGETIVLNDQNGIFNGMNISQNTTNLDLTKDGNNLVLKAASNVSTSGIIKYYKVQDLNIVGASILYSHPTSQAVGVLKMGDPGGGQINIKITNGKVKFSKTGEVFTNTLTGSTESGFYEEPQWTTQKLLGAEFTVAAAQQINDHSGNKLFDKDQVVDTIESTYDDDYSSDLPQGSYYWYESKVPLGYVGNLEKHYFEVSDSGGDNQSFDAMLENERPEQLFIFNKALEKHDIEKYQNSSAYKDVTFAIFARSDINDYRGAVAIPHDTMVNQFIIDADGAAKAARECIDTNADGIEQDEEIAYSNLNLNLPWGQYYIKEIKTNAAYELNTNEYDFSVEYRGPDFHNITLAPNNGETIGNNLKDFKVKVNKVDSITKLNIKSKDFEFSAYADKECTDVYKKVSANISDGTATFTDLNFGEYWIKETSAPIGFLLSDEVKHLLINEEGVFVDGQKITNENSVYSFVFYNSPMRSIRTGDNNSMSEYALLFLMSSMAISILIRRRKKRNQ